MKQGHVPLLQEEKVENGRYASSKKGSEQRATTRYYGRRMAILCETHSMAEETHGRYREAKKDPGAGEKDVMEVLSPQRLHPLMRQPRCCSAPIVAAPAAFSGR